MALWEDFSSTAISSEEYRSHSVTAVIAARNEERTVATVIKKTLPHVDEVIVMDGHSTDRTAKFATQAGARVVTDPGTGKGGAIRQSLELAEADIVVFLDADGSHCPSDIPRLCLPIAENRADLVVGSRFAGGSDELSVNLGQLVRSFGNIAMNVAINWRWNTSLTDTLNGYRAVRRSAIIQVGLQENIHTIEQEMVMKMLRNNYTVMNVPTHEFERLYGDSHIDIWREWPKFVWCLLKNLLK